MRRSSRELREGEWAERSWIDGLSDPSMPVEIAVRDLGVLTGHVRWATEHVVRLETATTNHVIASSAVQWVRGTDRSPGLVRGSVLAGLGWGPVLRQAQDDRDDLTVTLAGGLTCEGTVAAVGRDFVRIRSAVGSERDLPTAAICAVTFPD